MAKILIIDDDAEIALLLSESLKRDGHEVDCAFDSADGLKKIQEMQPDLAVLDFHLPRASGAHLFESLRRNEKSRNMPIIFTSGEASPEEILKEISDSEGSIFLPKPIHLDTFKKAVEQMLSRPKKPSP